MRKIVCGLALALILSGFAVAPTQNGKPGLSPGAVDQEWRHYGHDTGGMRFSPLGQINRTNVARLRRAWTFHTGEVGAQVRNAVEQTPGQYVTQVDQVPAFEATPLMVDGALYFSTPGQRVIALDAETGKQIWEFDSQSGITGRRKMVQHRGVAYWEGPSRGECGADNLDQRILVGFGDRLYALDARTGKPCPGFAGNGVVDLRAGVADRYPKAPYQVTSPPAIYKDIVITGVALQEYPSQGPTGAVRGWDVRTGKLVWKFETVPLPGQTGHETWEGDSWKDRSGTNVWSMMSVDTERGLVFLPLGSPSYDFYGADRKGQGLFGNSLVALDAATGKMIWYYQMVHHDLWDYDLPAQPNLITVRRDGHEIPAVAQVTKMGFIFVLDRLTGKPIFPIEERPVPASTIPGEAAWPTQPFPLKPPPLSRISLTREDLTTVTPESHEFCAQEFGSVLPARIFTPESAKLGLLVPGNLGGATWSGASFDPTTGYLYVNVNEVPSVGLMQPQPESSPERYRRWTKWGAYMRYWDNNRYPCIQPPWGTLNAVDMNTGEIAWKVTLGAYDELLKRGIPPTGAPSLGGTIATAGGLVFVAGTNDSRFRAFDSRDGKLLLETRLEASGHATPMTYLGPKTGKQFVVIAAGGGGKFSHRIADVLAAYSLPD